MQNFIWSFPLFENFENKGFRHLWKRCSDFHNDPSLTELGSSGAFGLLFTSTFETCFENRIMVWRIFISRSNILQISSDFEQTVCSTVCAELEFHSFKDFRDNNNCVFPNQWPREGCYQDIKVHSFANFGSKNAPWKNRKNILSIYDYLSVTGCHGILR